MMQPPPIDYARDLALALDPARLVLAAGIQPDPWQADVLRSNARQSILLCSRQTGKSTVSSFLALHRALFYPESLILLLAPSERQSGELFRKLKVAYGKLAGRAEPVKETALSLEFTNGSRIQALPGSEATIRGFSSVGLLVVDEASRVTDALYNSVRPMLAVSGGRLVLLSTPFGQRGFFHREWTEGGPHWKRVKITAYECPRIAHEWLEQERRQIGDWWFRQEYLCEFVDATSQVFSTESILGALSHEVVPLFETPRQPQPLDPEVTPLRLTR